MVASGLTEDKEKRGYVKYVAPSILMFGFLAIVFLVVRARMPSNASAVTTSLTDKEETAPGREVVHITL